MASVEAAVALAAAAVWLLPAFVADVAAFVWEVAAAVAEFAAAVAEAAELVAEVAAFVAEVAASVALVVAVVVAACASRVACCAALRVGGGSAVTIWCRLAALLGTLIVVSRNFLPVSGLTAVTRYSEPDTPSALGNRLSTATPDEFAVARTSSGTTKP